MQVIAGSMSFAVGLLLIVRSPDVAADWRSVVSAIGVGLVSGGLAMLFADLKRSVRANSVSPDAAPGTSPSGGRESE
jgi:threonine dehydratase